MQTCLSAKHHTTDNLPTNSADQDARTPALMLTICANFCVFKKITHRFQGDNGKLNLSYISYMHIKKNVSSAVLCPSAFEQPYRKWKLNTDPTLYRFHSKLWDLLHRFYLGWLAFASPGGCLRKVYFDRTALVLELHTNSSDLIKDILVNALQLWVLLHLFLLLCTKRSVELRHLT